MSRFLWVLSLVGVFGLAGQSHGQVSRAGGSGSGSFTGGTQGSFSGGSGGSGSFSGGSGGSGSFSGGSSGSFSGGFGTSGTGGSGGFTGGGTSGGRTGGSGSGVNQSNPFYKSYGNPMYNGLPTGSSASNNYIRQFPIPLSFGSALYQNLGTSGLGSSASGIGSTGLPSTGAAGTLGGLGGQRLGTGGTATTLGGSNFQGATTMGFRRAPSYITERSSDLITPRLSSGIIREAQAAITRSSRLPSAGNIRVVLVKAPRGSREDVRDQLVLQGRVRDERERRLAEAVMRLTPGVYQYEVKNKLEVPKIRP